MIDLFDQVVKNFAKPNVINDGEMYCDNSEIIQIGINAEKSKTGL